MKKLIAVAAALALSIAVPLLSAETALAGKTKAPSTKTCSMKSGGKTVKWQCLPDQTCCVTPDGKGVCGFAGMGCF